MIRLTPGAIAIAAGMAFAAWAGWQWAQPDTTDIKEAADDVANEIDGLDRDTLRDRLDRWMRADPEL